MFGSTTPFGQASTSPFGSQPNPFGQSPSTPAFGAAAPSQGFGTSAPAFGAQSSSFGGSSAFGSFGSATQPSPFGSSNQQSQPAFGTNVFGSTAPFGAPSQPSFGGTKTPAFGSSTTTPFGSTSASAFSSTPNPSFGSTGTAFGGGSTPAFGNTSGFGAGSAPAFGSTTTSPFRAASSPAFGQSSSQAFGGSTATSFGFNNSSPAFGQSTSSPFAPHGSSGAQATTPAFGGGGLGQPAQGGSRVTPYLATADKDGNSSVSQGKVESISAMQAYTDKSHEELRWEDYQRGDKGGPNPAGQANSTLSSGNPFGSSQTFGQTAANPFTSSAQTNIFAPNSSPFANTSLATTATTTFGSAPATTTSLFGPSLAQTSSTFVTPTLSFGGASSSATGSSSIFGSTPGQGQTSLGISAFGSQSSPLFQTSSASLGIGSSLGQTSSVLGQTPTLTNPFNTTNAFSTSGFQNSTPTTAAQLSFSQSTPSLATSFQPSLPAQPTPNSGFNFSNAGQTQAGGAPGLFGQSLGQLSNQSPSVPQPVAITNPFGTLPATPHISIGNSGTSPSIQYGISSMPVVDKPSPVRVSPLLTPRHLSQRRIRLPARKYHPKNDGSRVAFFSEEDESPSTPKADALFIPRENPRALTIRPIDHWSKPLIKEAAVLVLENGKSSLENQHRLNGSIDEKNRSVANGNGSIKHESNNSVKISQQPVNEHGGVDIEATMPKLRNSEYYTEPQIEELAAKERLEPGYCRRVKDFVVGRHGFGCIKFLGETDVRRLDLESIIQFNDREVIVYMDETKKPPVGEGLNKPAEVTLLNIKCFDKRTNSQISQGPKFEKYKEMLKKKADEQGAQFLSYDPDKTEWKFRVYHFSKYMLCDDDDDDDQSDIE